jgi:DNA-directed RNA polymerase subunit M/transcription elongation factor TFIIS
MVRQVIIVAYCSICWANDTHTEADTSLTITVDGSKPFEIDVCNDHDQVSLSQLDEFLREYGVVVKANTSPARSEICPDCGKTFASYQGRRAHQSMMHENGRKNSKKNGVTPPPEPEPEPAGQRPSSWPQPATHDEDGKPVCGTCGKASVSEMGYRQHVSRSHPELVAGVARNRK